MDHFSKTFLNFFVLWFDSILFNLLPLWLCDCAFCCVAALISKISYFYDSQYSNSDFFLSFLSEFVPRFYQFYARELCLFYCWICSSADFHPSNTHCYVHFWEDSIHHSNSLCFASEKLGQISADISLIRIVIIARIVTVTQYTPFQCIHAVTTQYCEYS